MLHNFGLFCKKDKNLHVSFLSQLHSEHNLSTHLNGIINILLKVIRENAFN